MQISIDEVKEIAADAATHIMENYLDNSDVSSFDLLHAFVMVHALSKFEIQARVRTKDANFYDPNTNEDDGSWRIYAFSLSDDIPRDMDGNEGWGMILTSAIQNNRVWAGRSWIMAEYDDEDAIVKDGVQFESYDVKETASRIGDEIAATWQRRILLVQTQAAPSRPSLRL